MGIGTGVESGSICQTQIVRTGEGHHPADVDGGIGAEQEAGGIHEEEIRVPEAGRLNGPEDGGEVAPGDPAQDVGGRKTGVIQKVRDVVVGNVEIAEAVKEIRSAPWPGAACDVVLYLSWRRSWRKVDLRVESGRRNWWLGQGD